MPCSARPALHILLHGSSQSGSESEAAIHLDLQSPQNNGLHPKRNGVRPIVLGTLELQADKMFDDGMPDKKQDQTQKLGGCG